MVKASDHGVPQHRPRLFIIAFHKSIRDKREAFQKPTPRELDLTMSDVLRGFVSMKQDGLEERIVGFTLRVGGKQSPIDDRRNWDGYWVNGDPHRLTEFEALQMQGFNAEFEFPPDVPFAERMKQLGNSVAVPAVQDYAEAIIRALQSRTRGK